MVQMRALLVLGGLFLAAGKGNVEECAANGAEAVDEMLNSAVFIWASVKRCAQVNEEVRCEINVASAIESVNGMINVIMKALEGCGGIKTEHAECGLAVGVLTKASAGMAASSGGIIAECPNALEQHTLGTVRGALDDAQTYGHSEFGKCVVDVKSLMKSLFQAVKRIMTVKAICDNTNAERCAHNSIKIVSAFASMGEFLANALDDCSPHGNEEAACAGAAIALVAETHNVARAALAMDHGCKLSETERLYLDGDEDTIAPATNGGSMTLGLVALLPITAVLSFVGGSRVAKARANAQLTEHEMLVSDEFSDSNI